MPQNSNSSEELHIGLMSGTSMDGIDGVLAKFDMNGQSEFICHVAHEFTDDLKSQLIALQQPTDNELHREALAGNALADAYAKVVLELIEKANIDPKKIRGIGAHGQTIRHQPGLHDEWGYTLQTLNASLLAELTGIDVIADFRSRDISANGQGAPLVPAFHSAQFSGNKYRAILNIGGIANLTLLPPKSDSSSKVIGFDCGPGNVLLDLWIHQHKKLPYDAHGEWAQSGSIIEPLLTQLLNEPFLNASPPKSTGRDLFNDDWLNRQVLEFKQAKPEDIQATLVAFTVHAAVVHIQTFFPKCEELYVCGGGVKNRWLMSLLEKCCQEMSNSISVFSTQELNIDPQTVEAMAFAWLSWAYFHDVPANLPAVTGARGPRILGARYPA